MFNIPMLRSDLDGYSDTYIVAKETITDESTSAKNQPNKVLTFRNNLTFRLGISKTNTKFIENAEDFDTVMSMSNLFQYSDNYSMTL